MRLSVNIINSSVSRPSDLTDELESLLFRDLKLFKLRVTGMEYDVFSRY